MPKIIKPAKGTFTTADITVDSSGRIIAASTGSAGGTFISATGGTITSEGDYKVHKFTSDANFVVTSVGSGDPESAIVDYVVVGGGGGGGSGQHGLGGGGGAGGYRSSGVSFADNKGSGTTLPVSASPGTYPVVVGAAGGRGSSPGGAGSNGGDSSFSTITSNGGGGGGGNHSAPTGNLGSGGGHGRIPPATVGPGNNPPTTPPQGTNGSAQGGGGASGLHSLGTAGTDSTAGMGAITFVTNTLRANNPDDQNMGVILAQGGISSPGGTAAMHYLGKVPDGNPSDQDANTGSGGAGASAGTDTINGASGVVYIRYKYK